MIYIVYNHRNIASGWNDADKLNDLFIAELHNV